MDAIHELRLELVGGDALEAGTRAEIVALCDRAYERDMAPYFEVLLSQTHVIASLDGVVVSHAMWVTRWLQIGFRPLLKTAYVEMVATEPEYQRRGYAASVMRLLAESITGFEIGALCPSDAGVALYPRLGWEPWRGPLFIRGSHEVIPTPEERVMVLRLPGTPELDLDAPLSAEWREGELW